MSDPLVALAPMSGISDVGMRRLAQDFGASFVVSEMVDADAYAVGDRESRLKAEGEGIACHIVQIAGCRADRLVEAARRAEGEGAAVVDINMGCPAKKVVGGLAGSALMRDLDHATALARAVVQAIKVPVTLKMRLGWDEGSINAAELARRVEAEGVRRIVVHGRTRCQFYKGQADWRAIRAVKDAVGIPVIANGDCTSLAEAREMLSASGADGIMIGRAAVGRPWLLGQIVAGLAGRPIARPSRAARRDGAQAHYHSLIAAFGREQGVRHARKHVAGYAAHAGVGPDTPLYRSMVTSDDPDHVAAMLSSVFDEPGAGAEP